LEAKERSDELDIVRADMAGRRFGVKNDGDLRERARLAMAAERYGRDELRRIGKGRARRRGVQG
jgi:hypothetical protein